MQKQTVNAEADCTPCTLLGIRTIMHKYNTRLKNVKCQMEQYNQISTDQYLMVNAKNVIY